MDVTIAEYTVVVAAIRYTENAANTVIRNLNYRRLKQVKEKNKHLRIHLYGYQIIILFPIQKYSKNNFFLRFGNSPLQAAGTAARKVGM